MSLVKKMVKEEQRARKRDTKREAAEIKMAEDDMLRRTEDGTNDSYDGITSSSGARSAYKKKADPWSYT